MMSADEVNSGSNGGSTAAAATGVVVSMQQHQQQPLLGEDDGIPHVPIPTGVDEAGVSIFGGDALLQEGLSDPRLEGAAAADALGDGGAAHSLGGADLQQGLTDEERTHRKIFVGGLSRNTSAESLREYFGSFGAVHATEVLFDKLTGRSRGFGFVTFEDPASVNNVVDRHHTIDESQVEVRRAIPREEARQTQPRKGDRDVANDGSGRVFIGGLGDEVSDDVLKSFFGQFGELASANVMIDRESNRPRGFGFVIFKNPEDADKALGVHKDLGPNCEAKRAQPRNQSQRGLRPGMIGGSYRMASIDPRYGDRGGRGEYDYQMGYSGSGSQGQMYGGYNYTYHPYYAAYYAQMAAAYGGGYGGYAASPTDGAGGADRGTRLPTNRSTPY